MSLKDHILQVMGDQELSIQEILLRLDARGWGPNDEHPVVYTSFMLNSHEEAFERVAKNLFRARPKYRRKPSKRPPTPLKLPPTLWQHLMED